MAERPHCPQCQLLMCGHLSFCAKCDIQQSEPNPLNIDGICGACILEGRFGRWSITSRNHIRVTELARRFPWDSDLPPILNNIIQQQLSQVQQEGGLEYVPGEVRFSSGYPRDSKI